MTTAGSTDDAEPRQQRQQQPTNNHSEDYLPASHLEKSQYAWTGTPAEGDSQPTG
jgi:hypothetical protein